MIRLQFTHASVCLQVTDDGVGFDPLTARGAGGLGLRSFNERVTKLGGQVVVSSQPGAGAMVTVVIGMREAL
jgi:signal transduction histidine kinase